MYTWAVGCGSREVGGGAGSPEEVQTELLWKKRGGGKEVVLHSFFFYTKNGVELILSSSGGILGEWECCSDVNLERAPPPELKGSPEWRRAMQTSTKHAECTSDVSFCPTDPGGATVGVVGAT